MKVSELNKKKIELVSAPSQYKHSLLIDDMLDEEEKEIFKRGRNVSKNHVPKNVTSKEYRTATGFETLFGYLYLKNKNKRLKEIFNIIIENKKNEPIKTFDRFAQST